MSALEAQQLSAGYGSRVVLEELSLAAAPGQVLALLGPNGSGKTTLMRALARLLKPSAGSVFVGEENIWKSSASRMAQRLALAPQNERREWPLPVEAAVRLGRTPHRGWFLPFTAEDQEVVEQSLSAAGLSELRGRPITELSGGEWRRMVLARALAQQAEVLLLDEPAAGLDLKYQHEMLSLVRGLSRSHRLTVLLTLHDLNLAALYADRVALLGDRAVIAVGTPDQVLTEPLIGRTFGMRVTVVRHPVYGTPLVAPLTGETPTPPPTSSKPDDTSP